MRRKVRLTFADRHVETITVNLADPFAAMDAGALVAAHGPVLASTLAERVEIDAPLASRNDLPSEMRRSLRLCPERAA